MTRSRAEVIASLTRDLRPTRRARRASVAAAAWLFGSTMLVTGLTVVMGPLRPDFMSQLLQSPRFASETAWGMLVAFAAAGGALDLAIPGRAGLWRRVGPGVLLLGAWASMLLYGLWDPALEPSMIGKRDHCSLEVVLYGSIPLVLGLLYVRGLAPLARAWTGALFAIAAGSVPALLMQLACMYDPSHALVHHLAPVAVLVAGGALGGPLILRRI